MPPVRRRTRILRRTSIWTRWWRWRWCRARYMYEDTGFMHVSARGEGLCCGWMEPHSCDFVSQADPLRGERLMLWMDEGRQANLTTYPCHPHTPKCKAKKGDHDNFIIRFLGEGDAVGATLFFFLNTCPAVLNGFVCPSCPTPALINLLQSQTTYKTTKTLMSAMLHRENERYDDDAISWYEKLQGVFGASQRIQ